MIFWFIGLSGLLLFLFSFYIYFASIRDRQQAFHDRLRNKAFATKEVYDQHDVIAEKIITSIPEQSEYAFDENNNLIFAINDLHDFNFDKAFFKEISNGKQKFFEYESYAQKEKEGFSFSFGEAGKRRTIVITAYDKAGKERILRLKFVLIFGNVFFMALIGLSGYLFSNTILKPLTKLVSQVESDKAHELGFRLEYSNENDEIGIVASSFNKVLERMQSLVESQKSFISYASHELRTPLASISGILETALKYDNDFDSLQKSTREAHTEVLRAIGLTNGLLQLAKIESAEGLVEIQRLNIVDLLIDTISLFKVKNSKQEFSFTINGISADFYIEMTGNLYLLRTAFYNIIDNASKYSRDEKIEISVSLISRELISVCVIDSGIGIDEDDMLHVLDPLFRGKNASGVDGYGLGLALTHRIVQLHRGKISLKRNIRSGITAEIILPATIIQNL
jgi:signal transduction histidine kinase